MVESSTRMRAELARRRSQKSRKRYGRGTRLFAIGTRGHRGDRLGVAASVAYRTVSSWGLTKLGPQAPDGSVRLPPRLRRRRPRRARPSPSARHRWRRRPARVVSSASAPLPIRTKPLSSVSTQPTSHRALGSAPMNRNRYLTAQRSVDPCLRSRKTTPLSPIWQSPSSAAISLPTWMVTLGSAWMRSIR